MSLRFKQEDRFDPLLDVLGTRADGEVYLTAQDLIASVVNLPLNGAMIQVGDGTKVNTNYVDVVKEGRAISYEIPFHCVTQQPIIVDGGPTLPLFCGKSRNEFEMKFIDL